ncbi:MAG: exonuclease SbcCD subunit D [Methanothrix sp.]|jgi:DNA repair exonuclease SbcCD nuclease subunit|uniref:Ser/Thr protein phosphatase family protein n=1 Tax=Methanothrix harundinacea TaxID=301375 RepID=A0A101FT08_9EURY|nr:MAG: Ser/Thr protein phosphatase family protein [Methanothrix harundinacea]MDD2638111.1 exonuclease SbcCD subunit D [Methanothrix sp.]MDI9399928.1 exonuclease SbcCD subunit D [Euryarchaeota archaeon]KUK96145.1 MAG: Ser/Thr protein phosphatase family protein [Methanothrix harundinacea]MCP1391268.1 exonuclease SbcCD subunit D [Methanothrix harundinacea]
MKIVHMADSHLGFSAYGRVDRWGRNQREEMIYQGFGEIIEKIIDLAPDAVVHAGDVFHHVRPRIRPLYVFKQSLERLTEAGIPVIIISGNHDAPKSYAAQSPFTLFEGMEGVHIAHHYRYERFEIDGCQFHCIPFCLGPEDYLEEFRKVQEFRMESSPGRDVLVMHGLVEALWDRRLRTVGEHELKESFLKGDFSYIALGHYHGQAQVAQNAWYSGSVEYFRFGEAKDDKGLLLVDLDSGRVEQIPVRERYMIDLDPVDCAGLSSREIEEAVAAVCDDVGLKDKIVRLRLKDASREAYRSLRQRFIGELKNQALHLEILPEFKEDLPIIETEPMDSKELPLEFKKFIEGEAAEGGIPPTIKEDVVSYGTDLMTKISEKRTTECFDASQ